MTALQTYSRGLMDVMAEMASRSGQEDLAAKIRFLPAPALAEGLAGRLWPPPARRRKMRTADLEAQALMRELWSRRRRKETES